jgi:hypothetical protein
MARQRTEMHRLQELVRLHRLGTGAREAARLLRMGPNTEREYRCALEAAGLLSGEVDSLPELSVLKAGVLQHRPPKEAPQQRSSVEKWAETIKAKFEKGSGPRAIYDWLRLEHKDFKGSLWAVKRKCRRLSKARGVQATDVVIRVETEVAEVAQVDFGYVGRLYDPDEGC